MKINGPNKRYNFYLRFTLIIKNMKKIILLAGFFISLIKVYGQIPVIGVPPTGPTPSFAVNWIQVSPVLKTASGVVFDSVKYNMFAVKINSTTISKFDIIENSGNLKHQDFLSQVKKDSTFIINACVSDKNGKPMGYYIKNSKMMQDVNTQSGAGNFYLKPNGALLFTANDAIICESSQIKSQANVVLGVQSGPMLITNGTIHPAFNQASTNKNLRCGVGIFTEKSGDKFLVFCMSNKVVNFYNFAMVFQALNCNAALSLDNAGVAMYFPNETDPNSGFNSVIHNYILYKY
jgi:uncharacterized protein YigE (DUF2233 family)